MFGSKKQKTSEPEQIIKTERNPDPDDMISHYDDVSAKLEQVLAKLEVSEDRHRDNEEKIKSLTENLTRFQSIEVPLPYNDITTELTSGDQIQLDSYKVIPEFSGNQKNYRSWREQVVRRMNLIENFKKHPKYEAALGIIRAKIIDTASDILINNNTKYNIDAIIERLDFSYADQRPLYVVEAEMTTIKQGGMTLQEYHDNINRALNMVITKIVMTYRHPEEQKSLTNEMQQKAVRTFIIGLKSATTRSILYGQSPKSLSAAFAIAQTVYYDNQYLQLEHKNEPQRIQTYPQQQPTPAKYNPKFKPIFNYDKRPQRLQQQQQNTILHQNTILDTNQSSTITNHNLNQWRWTIQIATSQLTTVKNATTIRQDNAHHNRIIGNESINWETMDLSLSTRTLILKNTKPSLRT